MNEQEWFIGFMWCFASSSLNSICIHALNTPNLLFCEILSHLHFDLYQWDDVSTTTMWCRHERAKSNQKDSFVKWWIFRCMGYKGTCRTSHVGMSTFPVGRVWKIKWYSQRQKKVTTSWSFFEQEHVCTMHVFHFTTWVRNDIHTLTRLSLPFSLSLRKQAIKNKETTHTYLCTVSASSLST